MKYTAPDAHIIESLPSPTPVNYECDCQDIIDGVYYSIETTGAPSEIGIQQIKIKRIVDNNFMKITVIMSTDEELLTYINSNTPPVLNF
jgi:hypothetical protein